MTVTTSIHSQFIEYLRSQLVGPVDGREERLVDPPTKRYAMGILFPQGAGLAGHNQEQEETDSESAAGMDDATESPISLAFQRLPASMGISFLVTSNSQLSVEVWGACYSRDDSEGWQRNGLAEFDEPELKQVPPGSGRIPVLHGRAELDVYRRIMDKGDLITVTLLNSSGTEGKFVEEKCIVQVGFRCKVTGGEPLPYSFNQSANTEDEEDDELALVYRKRAPYAIGHGCSATWGPGFVQAEVMPITEVRHVTTELPEIDDTIAGVLKLQFLMDESVEGQNLQEDLERFLGVYSDWIDGVESIQVPGQFTAARDRITSRLRESEERIRGGINTLCDPQRPHVLKAFRIATRAMLMQMVNSRRKPGAGKGMPDYESVEYSSIAWRPFQLAFQLLVMNSIVNDTGKDNEERELVDLIWFPTGGGKTEAYLAVAAFEIILRRMKHGDRGAGTTVITRYTFRLLTTQQFSRTAALVVALEFLRRKKYKRELGGRKVRLGLWVGQDTTPNKFTSAFEKYEDLLEQDKPENPFPLRECPWCQRSLIPEKRDRDKTKYGIDAAQNAFKFFCPDSDCPFHEEIPVSVIDDHLYQEPPTILIGTIDKFARLAWEPGARHFFGIDTSEDCLPPSLIIQDEMHLISGPLGTIAGLYEAALETVINSRGDPPKIIAATATIRHSQEQARKLYARDVNVFPPSGVNCEDSFFSREDMTKPGRQYAGVMSHGHKHVFTLVETSAALAQGPVSLGFADENLDAYWTQVIYHNSRRELGKTMTLARDDIPKRVEVIEQNPDLQRGNLVVEELSANVRGPEIPRVLELLQQPAREPGAIGILPCTSMISVGVDVQRLGLMLINGQPKNTSEYIQASSRVGRDSSRPAGIIVTLYSPGKPRDRSHYESFVTYHSSLYRNVNPTSVTPYAPPALKRAMHAAIVIVCRFCGGLVEDDSASRFDEENSVIKDVLSRLRARMLKAASVDDHEEIIGTFMDRVREWGEYVESNGDRVKFFSQGGRQFAPLLCSFGDQQGHGLWPTLNSMRNVDLEVLVEVR